MFKPWQLKLLRGPKKHGFAVSSRRRAEIIDRDGQRCRYCARELELSEITIDHIVAQTRDGRGNIENLCVCCRSCNSSKGASDWPKNLPRSEL